MRRARHTTETPRVRPLAVACAAVLALAVLTGAGLAAAAMPQAPASAPPAQEHAVTPQEPAAAPQAHVAKPEAHGGGAPAEGEGGHESGGSLLGTIGRLFNFAALVLVLVYFLPAPIAGCLSRRSTGIRSDLTKAAETRGAASAELAAIDRKMQALPGEIDSLKARGAREVAAEEARIRQTADAERERLLEQTRREIDLQVKAAERELTRHAPDLAIGLASERITRTITDEDQARLVDQ